MAGIKRGAGGKFAAHGAEVEFIVVREVDMEHMMGVTLAETMDNEGDRLLTELRDLSPLDTGALRGSLETEVFPDGAMEVRYRKDYGRPLDMSDRYHYRSTSNKGSPTKGWFSDTVGRFPASIVDPWVNLIEGAWRNAPRTGRG